MDELHKLIEKKKYQGFLSGRDALVFWRHVKARIDGSSGRWTQRDFDQLTRCQLGLPSTMQFQIVAGPVGAHAPKHVEVSPERRTLLRRKYGTFAERQAARKAKEASRQASLRLKKNGLTSINVFNEIECVFLAFWGNGMVGEFDVSEGAQLAA